jgi:polyphosphate:AMP phosphotransferase
MFEAAELGLEISDAEYSERVPGLRQRLLSAQSDFREADFPVILLFAGVDKGGKSEAANTLSAWMDPRRIVTHAYGQPSEEERERPEYWRFWRDTPQNGHIGIFLSAWYSNPLLQRVHDRVSPAEFDRQLDRIAAFERTLTDDHAVILKFWMHLGKEQQADRYRELEQDPLQSWRVSDTDWSHWKLYDEFATTAEHLIVRTSRGHSQWTIVEATDANYRNLEVGEAVLEGIERGLADMAQRRRVSLPVGKGLPVEAVLDDESEEYTRPAATDNNGAPFATVLSRLDLGKRLAKETYFQRRDELQGRLHLLQRQAREVGRSALLVFEGWDAGGKGGAIRRITSALDARDYHVIQTAAPNDEEAAHHYLWRFWRRLPRAGHVTIFDRSWYGRVLVERVEGFASGQEWRRAYGEINEFERELAEHGIVLVKFWLHISPKEQARRFEARKKIPYKRWKLTDEDLRNRGKWDAYESAVHEMVKRTSTPFAPWTLVEGEDKRYARIRVLETLCTRLERALDEPAPHPDRDRDAASEETLKVVS